MHLECPPHPQLRHLVRAYWQVEEFHAPGQEEHRFMPERTVRLNFFSGDSWQGGAAHSDPLERLPGATLTGMRLAPRRLVSVGLARALGVLGTLGLAVLAFWPGATLLYVAVIVMAIGEGLFTASLGAMLSNAAPAGAQGRVQSGAQSFGALAQVAGQLLAGPLYVRTGGPGTFGLSAALILLALGVLSGRGGAVAAQPDAA